MESCVSEHELSRKKMKMSGFEAGLSLSELRSFCSEEKCSGLGPDGRTSGHEICSKNGMSL
jgi:hypothetical protein